jgi:hypothetical protein
MKCVPFYVTADGKQFTEKSEAKKHEIDLQTLVELRSTLQASINSAMTRSGNIDNVLKHILLESAAISTVLANYKRKQPRKVVVAV